MPQVNTRLAADPSRPRPAAAEPRVYDQLARGKERFETTSYRKRDDEAEMRKHVVPEWQRVLPRW